MDRSHPALSWPRPAGDDLVACHLCDALQEAPRLQEGEAALCGCCGEVLFENRPRSLARATAWSSAALILMLLVHSFPFLTMQTAGIRTRLTLSDAAATLARDGSPLLSLTLIVSTILAPLALLGGLLYVAAPLRHGIALPGAVTISRWLQFSQPWSMLEVFLLGLLVSLLKLDHLAELHLGLGMWALAGLVICISKALAGIDRRELWDRLEVALAWKSEAVPGAPPAPQP